MRFFLCAAKKVKGRKQDFQTKIGGFVPPRRWSKGKRTEVAAFAENERQKTKFTNAGIHPRLSVSFSHFPV
ncbi:MAG: hypothetical protein EGP89_02310 [Ruminococcaceae bacterium]|nr:hypothetical protein [Oscillospiraceae bacterium]